MCFQGKSKFKLEKLPDGCFLQILLLIGENFDHADEICGAVVNVRPKLDKIGECQFIIILRLSIKVPV